MTSPTPRQRELQKLKRRHGETEKQIAGLQPLRTRDDASPARQREKTCGVASRCWRCRRMRSSPRGRIARAARRSLHPAMRRSAPSMWTTGRCAKRTGGLGKCRGIN